MAGHERPRRENFYGGAPRSRDSAVVRMTAPPGVSHLTHRDGRSELIQNGHCDVPAEDAYGLDRGGWKLVT